MNVPAVAVKAEKKANTKYRRAPNGSGCIKHLGGNRAKPYAAIAPIKEYALNGTPKQVYIGYFATRAQALDALANYRSTYNEHYSKGMTFAEVYKGFCEEKFVKSKKPISTSSINGYAAAFKQCPELHELPFADLRKSDLQAVLDASPFGYSSLTKLKLLLGQMYKFAMSHDIVQKNYAEFLIIPKSDDTEHGVPFTEEEIAAIIAHDADITAQIVLVLIYTGFRIGEVFKAQYDEETDCLIGGSKTDAGKNRTVPVHPAIKKYLPTLLNEFKDMSPSNFRTEYFHPFMESLGISVAAGGEKRTPHDTRHTFSWLCDKYGVDDLAKHIIIGHSLGKDVDKAVYGHRTIEELHAEINKLKFYDNNKLMNS